MGGGEGHWRDGRSTKEPRARHSLAFDCPPRLTQILRDDYGYGGSVERYRPGRVPAARLGRDSRLNKGVITPLGTWETELNGMFTGGAVDAKAPVTVNCSSHWFDAKDGVAAVARRAPR